MERSWRPFLGAKGSSLMQLQKHIWRKQEWNQSANKNNTVKWGTVISQQCSQSPHEVQLTTRGRRHPARKWEWHNHRHIINNPSTRYKISTAWREAHCVGRGILSKQHSWPFGTPDLILYLFNQSTNQKDSYTFYRFAPIKMLLNS